MHKYNNQDHSMLTAMTAVDNIVKGVATKDNIWAVNTEMDYHEDALPGCCRCNDGSSAPHPRPSASRLAPLQSAVPRTSQIPDRKRCNASPRARQCFSRVLAFFGPRSLAGTMNVTLCAQYINRKFPRRGTLPPILRGTLPSPTLVGARNPPSARSRPLRFERNSARP
jgi:hypothetical protein